MEVGTFLCTDGGNLLDGPGIKGRKIGKAMIGDVFTLPIMATVPVDERNEWADRGWLQLCTTLGTPRDVWIEDGTVVPVADGGGEDPGETPITLTVGTFKISGTIKVEKIEEE